MTDVDQGYVELESELWKGVKRYNVAALAKAVTELRELRASIEPILSRDEPCPNYLPAAK